MNNITQDILNRFSNLSDAPLVYLKVFDLRVWPKSLKEIAVYGNDAIVSLCEYYKDLLTDEEQSKIPNEWQQLKVRLSVQKALTLWLSFQKYCNYKKIHLLISVHS